MRLLILAAALCVATALIKLLLTITSRSIADNLPSNWTRGESEQLIAGLDHAWSRSSGEVSE